MVRSVMAVSSPSSRTLRSALRESSAKMIEVTVVSSKSPQLVAMPMLWVRCMHGSPRRSSP